MVERLSSGSPALNFLGAELALRLECIGAGALEASHLPGSLNDVADYLSRIHAPSSHKPQALPRALASAKERPAPARDATFYMLPPPGTRPDLWGAAQSSAGLAAWGAVASPAVIV